MAASPGTCANRQFIFCEDFESSGVGTVTSAANWTIESNRGTATVENGVSRNGKLLHLNTSDNGEVWVKTKQFAPPNNSAFGRMWVYVEQFPTAPNYAHWVLAQTRGAGNGTIVSPIGGQFIDGTVNRTVWGVGSFNGPTGDWTDWNDSAPAVGRRWLCMEWQMDASDNAVSVWIDGVARPELSVSTKVHSVRSGARDVDFRFPDFNEFRFGWVLYQPNSTPNNFDVWMDDLALATTRIGCGDNAANMSKPRR